MNRRQLLATLAALPAVSELRAQSAPSVSPARLKAGLVAYSYRTELAAKTLTYEDLIHKAAEWGLDGIDTTVYWFPGTPNTPNDWLANLRRTAFKNGIQLYNAGVRVRLCQATAELRAAEVENIKKWVDVADRIGASHMRIFGGSIPKGATEEQAIAWAVEVLKRGAEYSATKGITLGVEDDGGLTTTAEPTVAIARAADTPWAGINADSGNIPKNGYAGFELMAPYATSVHLKTTVGDENGKKVPADWSRLLATLVKAGYKGFVGLEYESDDAVAKVPGYIAQLRTLVRRLSA